MLLPLKQFDKSRSELVLAIQCMQLFLRQPSLGRQSIDNMKFPTQSLVSGFMKCYITKGAFECSG